MFQRKIQKISHPLAFDWPTQKSTSVGLQIQRMENDDELLCISDQGSLHFHIPYNNTCTFLITADNQPGGIKRGIKSQKLFDLRGHTSSGLQTDAVGGEINEAIGSCSDGPRLYCAAFRSGAWLYYLNRRAGQKKKIVILWSETPQCCVRPLKWTPKPEALSRYVAALQGFISRGGRPPPAHPWHHCIHFADWGGVRHILVSQCKVVLTRAAPFWLKLVLVCIWGWAVKLTHTVGPKWKTLIFIVKSSSR